ncbi:MAG: hypothetical protein ACM3SS_06880 [Rhodospirillaceae bacterium]
MSEEQPVGYCHPVDLTIVAAGSCGVITKHPGGPAAVALYTRPVTAAQIVEQCARANRLVSLVADDSLAISYQSIGQYRSMLLSAIAESGNHSGD